MTMASLKGGIAWPNPISHPVMGDMSTTFIQGQSLSGSAQKFAAVIFPQTSYTIHKVVFMVNAKVTNGDVDVRIETVDGTGNPTGTLLATNTNGTVTINGTGKFEATLTADATVTAGTPFAVVIAWTSGSYSPSYWGQASGAGGRYVIAGRLSSYVRYHNGTSWSTPTSFAAGAPMLALKDASNAYIYTEGAMPLSAHTKSAFNNTSATRERGAALIPRVPMRVFGFYVVGALMAGDMSVVLATTDGTARLTFAGDKDYGTGYTTSSNYGNTHSGIFGSTYDLVAGTTYYLTLKPTSATSGNLHEASIIDTADANGFDAWNAGPDCKLVTRDSGGAYTVSSTARPLAFGLLVSHVDDGAGAGGGLLTHPGMAGGLRG